MFADLTFDYPDSICDESFKRAHWQLLDAATLAVAVMAMSCTYSEIPREKIDQHVSAGFRRKSIGPLPA